MSEASDPVALAERIANSADEWMGNPECVTLARALIEERYSRPPLSTWRGTCGHLWDREIENTYDCPRCASEAARKEAEEEMLQANERAEDWSTKYNLEKQRCERLREALENLVRRLDHHFGQDRTSDWKEQEAARVALAADEEIEDQ